MSKLVLYHSPESPFSRSVLLFCRFLKIDVEVKILDLMKGEQNSEEFLKINPQHCVPTIDDNGFYLWESRAILSYLMESRAAHLLQTSPKEKAIINQRLHSETCGLAKKAQELYNPLFEGSTELSETTINEIYEILAFIDEHYFPHGNEWIAGENISVADFSYVALVAELLATGASLEKFPRVKLWYNRCKITFPDFQEANEEGAASFGKWVEQHATKGF